MVQRLFAALCRVLALCAWDLLAAAGLALVAIGAGWLWHPGMGLIIGGAGILALGIFGSYKHGPPE